MPLAVENDVGINEVEHDDDKTRKSSIRSAEVATNNSSTSKGPRFGCRHVQCLLLCLAFFFGIGTRNNMSVAVVAMTDNSTSTNPDIPYYDWSNTSVILSSFFWGYLVCQLPAGYLGKVYGPKYFLLVTFFLNCCACALIPLVAERFGSNGVLVSRVVMGLCQGFLTPSIHILMGTWVPSEERSTFNNFVYTGFTTGSMYGSLVTGYVSSSWLGWPYSFYILGLFGFLWCILWFFFGYDSPAQHPHITQEEKKYIQTSLKQEDGVDVPIPWSKIATCVPFYVVIIAIAGSNYGVTMYDTEVPTYLTKMVNFDVKSDALITTLTSCLGLVLTFFTGPFSDWVITKGFLTRLKARRIFHLIGAYGHALCLLCLAFLTKSQAHLSIVILAMNSVCGAFTINGAYINHLDLSPRFCGILFAFINAGGQIAAIVAPLVAQWVITDQTDPTQWRMFFLSGVAVFAIGGTVFGLFSSAERQPWDGPDDKELEERRRKSSVISVRIS